MEHGQVETSDGDGLGHDGDGSVHQFAVGIVEIVFQTYTVGIGEGHCLVAASVIMCPHREGEDAAFHLCLVEHPPVEHLVLVVGGGHDEGNGATPGARCRLVGLVYGLRELVLSLHDAVAFPP